MKKEVVGYCPVCNERLIATTLTCRKCKTDITGQFSLNRFSYLNKDEQEFIFLFLASEGRFKEVQKKMNITYLRAKQMLSDVLIKLDLRSPEAGDKTAVVPTNYPTHSHIYKKDHYVVQFIKEKLNTQGGMTAIPLLQANKEAKIWFSQDGTGLECDKIPIPNQLTWDAFTAAYHIAAAQDGELYKGYARAGRLGSQKLPLNSLEGYIAYAAHGIPVGSSAYSSGFIIAAVLDWAGVFINERGSRIRLVPETVCIDSYYEALHNAVAFLKGAAESEQIKAKLDSFRHWYYFEEIDQFAPRRFIGYRSINIKAYEAGFDEEGKSPTEEALKKLFIKIEGLKRNELYTKLTVFLKKYDLQPDTDISIYIRREISTGGTHLGLTRQDLL